MMPVCQAGSLPEQLCSPRRTPHRGTRDAVRELTAMDTDTNVIEPELCGTSGESSLEPE